MTTFAPAAGFAGPTQGYPTQPYMPQQGGMVMGQAGGMVMGGYPGGMQNGQSQEAKILANFPAGSFFLPQQNVSVGCLAGLFGSVVLYALCGYVWACT